MWLKIAVLALIFLVILPPIVLAGILYAVLLVRTRPDKWGRECSIPDDEEYLGMFNEGMAWDAEYGGRKQEVSIVNDGFRLAGEYFDFGADRAVIILPGRMESLLYSYYFAEPYRRCGWNVLVIDTRSHGLSEGKINSLGYKEYRDVIAWGKMLHDRFGMEQVFLHGICIGSSTALFALTSPDCPDYFCGMTGEGMYVDFYESFRNHLIEKDRPQFPFLPLVMAYIRVVSGANVVTDGPLWRIGALEKPLLMLHSREDIYSMPDKAEQLYAACRAPKRLVWFDHGAHSRIRPNDREGYDEAIAAFLDEFCPETVCS